MSPAESYQHQIHSGQRLPDAAQARALDQFQHLHERLTRAAPAPRRGLLGLLRPRPAPPVSGLYLWGGVGRGKTWLMDLFFHALPFPQKQRVHFHHFMGRIHRELDDLKGQREPLQAVARRLAGQSRVLCLDELQVWDIGDAMILGGLLRALFAEGVTLVATSNCAPDSLYPNGLQRASFLPAIDQIKTNTQVVELDCATDYRRRILEQAEVYHSPLDLAAERVLADAFRRLAPEPEPGVVQIEINGRPVPVRAIGEGVIWLDFADACDGPRSQADYLELARCHHTLLLSGIPCMGEGENDQARRFINLVDVLYDHNVKLLASAEVGPDGLYTGTGLAFQFRRTASRLREMGSREWLGREHLA